MAAGYKERCLDVWWRPIILVLANLYVVDESSIVDKGQNGLYLEQILDSSVMPSLFKRPGRYRVVQVD